MSRLFWTFLRWILHLRYRVRVTGLDQLADLKGPTLVMPNHPGYIDPPLVLSHVRLSRPVRPVVFAGIYRIPVLYPIMRLVDALEVPDLAEHSQAAHERTLAMIDSVVEGLQRGESFLIYPSGRLRRQQGEVIGAARATHEILQRVPQANVVLVRTQGVWGSMFSYARTGNDPLLGRRVIQTILWMIANLLFFAPRRNVHIHLEVVPRDRLPSQDRDRLNRFLEQWYDKEGVEQPTFVPYHPFLGPRDIQFPELQRTLNVDLDRIREKTKQAVNEVIEEFLGRPLTDQEKQPEATLDLLGLDSLERMELALAIEDRFGFRSDRVAANLGELWALAEGQMTGSGQELVAPPLWTKTPQPVGPGEVLAETMAEAFVRRVLAGADDVVTADATSGTLTYRRMLVGCTVMGRRFAELPGDAVGVMLPSSVAADLVYFGLHTVGKLPVMLNWTTGPANLAHAIRTLDIKRVVTSRRFIDRLRIEIQDAELVFLEDLREGISKWEQLRTLAATYLAPGSFLKRLPKQNPDDPAVVLFTSGSESAPKAVPLSHRNLLTNVTSTVTSMLLRREDAMLGALPPFHSFGLLANMIAPITSGFRVVHHPDPTDAAGLVRVAAAYRPAITATTPTFLSYIFATATPEELGSLTLIATGAEKCPDALFAKARQMVPGALILEGYGITECSPIVAANRRDNIKPGTVGIPVKDVDVCVVHPETNQPLPIGETGMLLVRGPSIFGGYLNYDGPDPFVTVDSHRWYKTGDLVMLDEERFIHFRGRLKRFLKAGGEMISLPALEEPFSQRFPPTEDGPQVAVEGVETPTGRHITLFTTQDLALRDANQLLTEAGFRGVMRLDEVCIVDAIPVLGTGKTDYKALRKMVNTGSTLDS
ncbi:MAG: AMP-binding protein [Planctomycetaceae bacterium]|nr:AMP-binding protein [Planctomycetaceae bacterium]